MFVDKAKIYVKAGNGGDGIVAFLRLKGVPYGGPNGGDGGNGGNIVFVATKELNNLSPFYYQVHYRAEDGERGQDKNCDGKSGKDLIIKVPQGTIIRDFETKNIIADMFYEGEKFVLLRGGKGGRGNTKFCTPTRRSPSFAQKGSLTEEKAIVLELKTIADCGLVGFPNVGKSTLLSRLTSARPKIANYHFTTLSPSLGVSTFYDKSFVVADIPGLIEGASTGLGLGHEFLRHIERTRLLLHVIDMSGHEGRNPIEDYEKIMTELSTYSEKLAKLPQIIIANKMDIFGAEDNLKQFSQKYDHKIIATSAISVSNFDELKSLIVEELAKLPQIEPLEFEPFEYEVQSGTQYEVVKEDDGTFVVTGGLCDVLSKRVNLEDVDSFNYFQKQLKRFGVIDKLRQMGAKDGDTIVFADFEFEFLE